MSARVSIEDSRWLADLAGLSDVVSITPMEGGWDNSNNLLELSDGGRFVLKIWGISPAKPQALSTKS